MSNRRHMRQLLLRVVPPLISLGTDNLPYRADPYYTALEALQVADWLAERATGYLRLKRFEGGKLWPAERPIMPFERACHDGLCCRVARDRIEANNLEAYHGDIDGDGDY